MGDVARRTIAKATDITRDCHQEGHHWENPDGWIVKRDAVGQEHLEKRQRCLRSGVGCGCVRVLRMTRRTLRPIGRPYIVYPDSYRYPQRMSRWELRAEEAGKQ